MALSFSQNVSNQETFEYEECSVQMTCERLDDTSQWHKEVLLLGGPGWITEVRGQTYANPKIFLCEGPEYFSPSFVSVTWRKDNIARLPLKGVKDNLLF